MAVTAEWCAAMRAARKAQNVSQAALAKAVGASQPTISTIESGVDDQGRPVASSHILAICRHLKIDPPVIGQSAAMLRWIAVGRALEHRDPETLAQWLATLERTVQSLAPATTAATPDRPLRH
ncbi:MAG: helix-turn-helix transcriptional regulator [Alphaproteobacteria bacterium]|jgi:transcriptional regulator with XRE-family HTH domain